MNVTAPWRRPNRLLASALVLVVIATVFAAWAGGWSWARAAHSARSSGLAQVRDRALADGEQDVQNFNTLDYRKLGAGLRLWEQSSTGALRSQVASGAAKFEKDMGQARTITSARILDGALTALNAQAGTATIMAAVQITVVPPTGTPAAKQERLLGRLVRTPAGWKLSSLGQVPVGAAGK
jgi:Mce-associated membrane protein